MKSRKSAKVSKKSQRADLHRKSLRGKLRSFETLEDRKLLTVAPWSDGFYYPPIALHTGFLPTSMTAQEFASISAQQFGGGSGGSGMHGEGTQPFINASETEPNNNASQANFVNLGTLPSQSDGVAIVGRLTVPTLPGPAAFDEDYFAFDLRAGDVLDMRVNGLAGATFDLSLLDANRQEVIGTNLPISGPSLPYPENSPLEVSNLNPQADLAVVIPTSGRYYARVSDGDSAYTLTLRTRRPFLESQPVGTKQTIFLDFDGAFLRRDIFGVPGTARLSPLSSFLPGWGLSAADESRVIDQIIEVFESKFFGPTALSSTGGNGYYSGTGTPGNFDLEILNSRDHADPFGQPNVSRMIIGGTQAELLIPTVGIAQSVDVGNFVTEETGVVLLDLIEPQWGLLPRAGNITLEQVVVDAVGAIAAHEAGHIFGMHHTLNTLVGNNVWRLNDAGGTLDIVGQGNDGVYGTADDIDIQFGTDIYDPIDGFVPFGRFNAAAALAFGLSTGTTGGATVAGNVFHDRNMNQLRDSGDSPLVNTVVYADLNNNAILDGNDVRTLTDFNGDYRMTLVPGTYFIRQQTPAGYQLSTPANNVHAVTIASGQTLAGRNFVNQRINPSITGVKWNDLNGNQLRDAGEPGIGGVYVYIDLDNDNRIDIGEPAALTNSDGSYRLSFPTQAGVYTIREIVQPGYTQSYPGPAAGFEHSVTLTGNPALDTPLPNINFGNRLTIDYGDAPASYGVASHGRAEGLNLGTLWDAEVVSQHSPDALGDDNNGSDDEDAIDLNATRPLIKGSTTNPITVTTTNTTGQTAYLQAWIDFNGDGVFADFTDTAGNLIREQVVINQPVNAASLGNVSIAVPDSPGIVEGDIFARLRLSYDQNIGPTGQSLSGEVEDYPVRIIPTPDFAIDDSSTVSRNSVLNPIDVLANDIRFGNETLEIVNVSNPSTQGGTVTFTPELAFYTPRGGFIGRDTFTYAMRNSAGETYTATVTVDVNLFFENPLAIDDSFDVPTNGIDIPLNVLANDIEGQNGALSILSITQPSSGGSLSIAAGNKSLRYTPQRDFGGTETFTYTAQDAAGNRTTARVTLHTLPGARANDQLQIRLQVVANGADGRPTNTEIGSIQQGQEFWVVMLVDDLRNPDVDAGVFSAFTDLLYNFQMVSTVEPGANAPAGFNFEVFFDELNRYTNGQSGDATVPGIVNEFGAFFDGLSMNRPNEVRLGAVKFEAKTPGLTQFIADPADVSPSSDTLLFDSSSTPVPLNQIRYLGASLEIVADGVVFPVAVDDSLPTPITQNASRFPIDVLANDLPGSAGPITLQSSTNGAFGTTRINAGKVEYTPNLDTTGTADQFTYTIVDSQGRQSTATVSVKIGNQADNDDIVDLRLEVTDLTGAPIERVAPGAQFQLRGYVSDLRSAGARRGIFAAYQDVLYSSTLVMPVASATNAQGFEVSFGLPGDPNPAYDRVKEGDIRTVGLINELGAVASQDTPLGSGEFLQFIVTMQAKNVSGEQTATFIGDPADISPFHDTLTYEPVQPVSFDKIRFGFDSVVIGSGGGTGGTVGEGEFTNRDNPLDVNADGFVSPIDALAVINALNAGGSRTLIGGIGVGEGEEGGQMMYIDTNGDNFLSAIDVLNVINYLNLDNGGSGEGEATVPVPPIASLATSPASTNALTAQAVSLAPLSGTTVGQIAATPPVAASSQAELFAADGIFDDEEDAIEDLLNQIAPSIEQAWNS